MRGRNERQAKMLFGVTPDDLVPAKHPIRRIRTLVDELLTELSPSFDKLYRAGGRPSIPPEHLLKGTILMALYSIRSERQFCERLQYDLLFKWFLGLNITDDAFDATAFSHYRQRLLDLDVAKEFLGATARTAKTRKLISEEHFSVDGTLLQAWASIKSFRPKDETEPPAGGGRNAPADFHGQRLSNETHASTTDEDARLARKGHGHEARLSYSGHLLTENRNGLIVDAELCKASGTAERDTALELIKRQELKPGCTLGADKAYDTRGFVDAITERGIVPHIAQNTSGGKNGRRSAVPDEVAKTPEYELSQRRRKLVEEPFGWLKTVAASRKLRYIGLERNRYWFLMAAASCNLVRIAKLSPAAV